MRRVSFALVFTALLLSFGLANALNITAEFVGSYDEGGTDYLSPGSSFDVVFNSQNTSSDPIRLGWSSPFHFYGTGATALGGVGTFTVNTAFEDIWGMGTFEWGESFDGDLTTGNTTLGAGEHYNFSGISMDGYPADDAVMWAFTFGFALATSGADCTAPIGTFCVAQGDMDDNTYDWLFEDPVPTFAEICIPVKVRCNIPPEITGGCTGVMMTQPWNTNFVQDFDGNNGGDGPSAVTWGVDTGPGGFAGSQYTYSPDCADVGAQQAIIYAFDGADYTYCTIDMTVTNQAPVIAGDCGEEFPLGTNTVNSSVATFTATDVNGGTLTWTATSPEASLTITVTDGVVDVTTGAVVGLFTITVTVEDCGGLTDACTFDVDVISSLPYEIVIEKEEGPSGLGALQGHHTYVDVTKEAGSEDMHGFDFLIGYDGSALTFMGAMGGVLFDMPGAYEWEYFTYRYSWNGNCGNGCPSGLLRVVGMAEQNDGPHQPVSTTVANGTVLFTLDFLVTNDRTFECMYAPVYFYWMDCGDNAIAYHDATAPLHDIQTAVSKGVFNYTGAAGFPFVEVTDPTWGFPGAYGILGDYLLQTGCFMNVPGKPTPIPFIYFFNGGVDIICADDIDARGDMNLNGLSNEIADAVVLTNYFLYGLAAFTVNVEGQIAASDVNADGMPLSVADLVYLIRVIVGDALPYPKVAPTAVDVIAGNVIRTNVELGAAAFTFAGQANVTLAEGASDMELKTNFRDGNTYVLIYSFTEGVTANGDLLNTNADLISFEAATYHGAPIQGNLIPAKFELSQNYPNPFNPKTVVNALMAEASDYTLSVYNITGQKVMDFSGFSEAGKITFDLDMKNEASGIYFYKFEAGSFSKTMKMVLLK